MTYGLVLEGGGGRGGFHIGVWQALRELNIEINGVTGTSVGALHGALFALGKYDEAVKLWSNIQTTDVLDVDDKIFNELFHGKKKPDSLEAYLVFLKDVLGNKGFNITPLKKLIATHMNEDELRKSNIDFGFVTVSLTDHKPLEVFIEDIGKGKIEDYLLASSFLPVFREEQLDGKKFIDGCFFDNLPIRLLMKKGYRKIIVVHLNGFGLRKKVDESNLEVIHIYPSGNLGSSLLFHPLQSRQNIQMGYLDALKAFGKLFGNRYYFANVPSEEEIFSWFLQLPRDYICEMAWRIYKKQGNVKRILLERLIPQLARLLNLSSEASYQLIYLSLLEYGAQKIGLLRLKIYDFQVFQEMVIHKFTAYGTDKINVQNEESNLPSMHFLKNKRKWILFQWFMLLQKNPCVIPLSTLE